MRHLSRFADPLLIILFTTIFLAGCGSTPIQTVQPPSITATSDTRSAISNDYANGDNWLCLPGRDDSCSVNLDATLFKAGGTLAGRERFHADPNAPIDCFYVYPTVSNDDTPNSDMIVGDEERRAAEHQFARFGSECKLYAPVYRQTTIKGMLSEMSGKPRTYDPQLAYRDVLTAWNYYLQHYNKGRGVVLVGHSQGSQRLAELLQQQIEGKPVQKQLVSAILPGYNVMVPKGHDTGGTFSQLPLCRSAAQTGCVISYESYRENSPPPANTSLGRATDGNTVACTNPAALAGGRGVLHSYFSVKTDLNGRPLDKSRFVALAKKADAPYASPEAIATAECVQRDNHFYLSIGVNPAYTAAGFDIPGDLYSSSSGRLLPNWGLHIVDVDVAQGSLIDIVRQQSKAWMAK